MKLPVDRSCCLLCVGDEASACCTPCCGLLLAVSTLAAVRASRAPTLSNAMPALRLLDNNTYEQQPLCRANDMIVKMICN
jgi:hypothetical protein